MAQRPRNPIDKQPLRPKLNLRPHRVPVLILWGLAMLAYANSFRAGLVFDNRFVIAQDTRIRAATAENVKLIFTQDYWYQNSSTGLYRPLTTLTYLVNYAILGNGDSPAGYHAGNLLLHCVNITLVYVLGWMLFAEFWPAVAMAALWGVHPALTESVTNIVGRADLLAAFGVLAGLVCYARSLHGGSAWKWRLLVLLAATVGMFSKESGIVIVAAIFLYDVAYCRTLPLRERAMGYLAAAPPIVAFLVVRQALSAKMPLAEGVFTDNPLVGADFLTSRLTAVKVLGEYWWKLIWPVQLSCDYSYNQIPLLTWKFTNWEDWKTMVALLACTGAALLALWCYRRSKPLFFFLAFFFASLAPTANIFLLIGTIMAERFLYLPAIGLAGILAWVGWKLHARYGTPVRIALAILCLAYATRTFARNFDWYTEETLWTSAVSAAPSSYKAHQHLASILAAPPSPRLQPAEREIERSLAILKTLPDERNVAAVYTTAGFIYRSKGASSYSRSLEILREGERLDNAWFQFFYQRNAAQGKTVALTGWAPLYLELGRTYRALADYPHALEALTHGIAIQPQTQLFEELSSTYRDMNNPDRAAISLLQGITMGAPDQSRLAAEVVDLYRQVAPQSCALSGNSLNFGCPLVRQHLCGAAQNAASLYHQVRRDNEAASAVRSAVGDLGCPAEMFR